MFISTILERATLMNGKINCTIVQWSPMVVCYLMKKK